MKDPAAACVTQNGGRIVAALEREIALCRARCGELQAELANTKEKLERYEQALMILTDNAPPADRQRVYTSQIEQVIVAYVLEHGEFRQVDIRAAFGNELAPSSALKAFDRLEKSNVIRFARQDGSSKFYRLTREAL